MKTFKFLSIIFLLVAIATSSCGNKSAGKSRSINAEIVAVFYTSDEAVQVAGAAIVGIKYAHCTYFDIEGMSTGQQLAAIQTITDSVHRVILMCDTATAWADNKLTGAQYDSLDERLFKVETDGVDPDATPTYIQATSSKTKTEVLWADVYSTFTQPLIVQYLGYNEFNKRRNITKHLAAITDSTMTDSTGSLTADAYIGDYLYIYSGTGFGHAYEIYDNSTSVYFVTPDWEVRPHMSLFYVKDGDETVEGFYDQYANCYVLANLWDLSDVATIRNWHKLIDKEWNINDGNVIRAPFQDLTYLKGTVIAGGKLIYDYLRIVAE